MTARDSHVCPGCKRWGISNAMFACTTCWRLLPIDMRKDIEEAYRNRKEKRWEHIRAMGRAMAWYREQRVIPDDLEQYTKAELRNHNAEERF